MPLNTFNTTARHKFCRQRSSKIRVDADRQNDTGANTQTGRSNVVNTTETRIVNDTNTMIVMQVVGPAARSI